MSCVAISVLAISDLSGVLRVVASVSVYFSDQVRIRITSRTIS